MESTALRRIGTAFIEMPPRARIGSAITVAVLMLATTALVYATGGVRFAYLHFMYVPVVLAGFAFGLPGGLLAGVGAGLLLGPLMPIDTSTGEMQLTVNWLFRMGFFVLIGAVVGVWAQILRRHLRELSWLHEHHEATGLLNESGLLRQLDERIRTAGPRDAYIVTIAQLNAFLEIQNTFGAGFGMRVLTAVVERTRTLVPPGSLIALVQPDRIATVVPGALARRVTRSRIETAVRDPYLVDGLPVHVDASVGVAQFPAHGSSAEELLQKASIAMHWADRSKSPISVYDVANDTTSRDNLILLGALHDAIEQGQLEVWHQAKLKLATGQLSATEALVRWKHPERGYVSPGSFIPQVEETMLINQVTHTVIASAFAHARRFRDAGYPLRVAVNLSVRNLRDRTLLESLDEQARKNGLDPSEIELEITESAVMDDPEHCIRLISVLRDRGYGVAIDDFGVGHSSLAYLLRLRVTTLKIDQDFVKTLPTDPGNQTVVQAIIGLANSLGLETIAEGVEDERSIEMLRAYGCTYAQGYAIHKPAPADELLRFVETWRDAPATGTVGAPAPAT
jgi:predicted signal transduction protein with EAL and GGDEF domain